MQNMTTNAVTAACNPSRPGPRGDRLFPTPESSPCDTALTSSPARETARGLRYIIISA
jgi:hypothetical protein